MQCPKCRKEIADTVVECPHCHIVVESYLRKQRKMAAGKGADSPPPVDSSGIPFTYILLAVVLAAGIYFLFIKPKNQPAPAPEAAKENVAPVPAPAAPEPEVPVATPESGTNQVTEQQAIDKVNKLADVVPLGKARKEMVNQE